MRDRLLIRHFLWRFLEHDLVSPNSDRRSVLSAVAGLLVAVSLFVTVLVAVPYQLFPSMPPGIVSLRSLDDRFLFVSMSMLVMALAAVGQWDALTLDARDAAVLGTLPIPHGVIVRSKFAATGLLALAVLVACNVCPTLLHLTAVPAGLRIGWRKELQLTLAHGIASGAAGLFGFFAVLSVREIACALFGPARFQRVSAPLQAAMVTLLTTALLLLPAYSQIGRRWVATEGATAKMLPPLWFVGLHETLAGSVIDSVPRTRPNRFLVRQEETATTLYRSLRPVFPRFAGLALAALLVVMALAVVTCLWNSRRLPSVATRSPARRGVVSRRWNWLTTRVVARSALQQAGFFFAVQAMSRRASNRITMAAALAVAVSVMIVAAVRPALATDEAASISVALLAAQSMVIGVVLTGFRHATRVPAELQGSMTFGLAWQGVAAPFIVGVKRAGWVGVALPTLIFTSIWHTATLGPRLALLHLGVGIAVAILVMDALFFRNRRVPFASIYVPSPDATVAGTLYCAAVVTASLVVAFMERVSFEAPRFYVGLLVTLLGISVCLRWFDRVSATSAIELDLDEQAPLQPTQRFSLSS